MVVPGVGTAIGIALGAAAGGLAAGGVIGVLIVHLYSGYDLCLMSALPESKIPEKGKIYLDPKTNAYTMRGIDGEIHAGILENVDLSHVSDKLKDSKVKKDIAKAMKKDQEKIKDAEPSIKKGKFTPPPPAHYLVHRYA